MAFTITWEDSKVEQDLANELFWSHRGEINALLLAESMDTALSIYPYLSHLTLVSSDLFPMALFKLKKALLLVVEDSLDRIAFLTARMSLNRMIKIYRQIEDQMGFPYDTYWRTGDRLPIIFRIGILQHDGWFQLFLQWKNRINSYSQSLNHRTLRSLIDYQELFNSIQCPWSKYFKNVLNQLICDTKSPFTSLVFSGEWEPNQRNNSIYLTQNSSEYDTQSIDDHLVHCNLDDFLERTHITQYLLISLGNLTDRYQPDQLEVLFESLQRLLHPDGRLVLRRRNSDYPLEPIVNRHFIILNYDRNHTDRTHFYSEVILAGCRR